MAEKSFKFSLKKERQPYYQCSECKANNVVERVIQERPVASIEGVTETVLVCWKCKNAVHAKYDHPTLDEFREKLKRATVVLRRDGSKQSRKRYYTAKRRMQREHDLLQIWVTDRLPEAPADESDPTD